jgi:EAL domain-containing protein (putative c-di-GMP-specific phosphodiesterase class I)/AmiR/NasT family two-component response regulator
VSAHRIRVLIAEEDETARDELATLVRSEPSLEIADVVSDAAQAILVSMREKPAFAVLGVRIPGGGASAARGIKRCSPQTRVLALSAQDDRETVLEMLEAGADGYLVKGSTVDTIVNSIERAARGQGSLSAEMTGSVIEELAGLLHARRRNEERSQRREERIRRALDEDLLHAVFQPICTLAGSTIGAEALARFRGPPSRGPVRWFAEADEVGLLRELELAAVRVALAALPALPEHLFLSVNVSPSTLATPAFLRLIAGSDGARVVVEITEHARINDYESLQEALGAVREFGARVAIDEAGAGFASLRHILRLEPEFIKLDRTLIDGIESDRSLQALAAGLISFAEKIDATIVAEGIERPAEVEALAGLGVRYGQGYFFARPAALPLPLLVGASAADQDSAA